MGWGRNNFFSAQAMTDSEIEQETKMSEIKMAVREKSLRRSRQKRF